MGAAPPLLKKHAWSLQENVLAFLLKIALIKVGPSMNQARADLKYLETCDFGKPFRRFRRHQSQNCSRHRSTDQHIDRIG